MNDPVKTPDHYRWISGVECKDVAAHFPFFLGCAIKYIWRAGRKAGETRLQALEKAHECIGLALAAERDRSLGQALKDTRRVTCTVATSGWDPAIQTWDLVVTVPDTRKFTGVGVFGADGFVFRINNVNGYRDVVIQAPVVARQACVETAKHGIVTGIGNFFPALVRLARLDVVHLRVVQDSDDRNHGARLVKAAT